jgi:hypothetical protein
MAEKMARELEYFTNIGRVAEPDKFTKKEALLGLVCDLLMSPAPTNQATGYRAAKVLDDALQELAIKARERALAGGSRSDKYVDACIVAAVGELLGLPDKEKNFEKRLVQLKGRRDDYDEQYATAQKPRAGKKERRQVRAAVWLDVLIENNKFSPNYASEHRKELIFTFSRYLVSHIQQRRPTLVAPLSAPDGDAQIPDAGNAPMQSGAATSAESSYSDGDIPSREGSSDDPKKTDQFKAIDVSLLAQPPSESSQAHEISEQRIMESLPEPRQLEMLLLGADASPFLTRENIASIPFTPVVRDALDAARASCAAIDRRFFTPYLLLALFNVPDSKAAWCFDCVKAGLADRWRRILIAYREDRAQDETSTKYKKFDWNDRRDVWQAKQLTWLDGRATVDELYLLLGILYNDQSETRHELAQYLGQEDYERLHQLAEGMRDRRA